MLSTQRTLRSTRRVTVRSFRPAPLPEQPLVAQAVSMAELVRFKALMDADGEPVHLARMCYDRAYAFERIALAHAGVNDPLRRLALSLFQAYQRRDEAGDLAD